MKISGFTIARNIVKYNYPAVEAIRSILPICDELIVNVGDSEDRTLEVINSINSPKLKIFQTKWDDSLGEEMLAIATNFALKQCRGDWAFYIQTDEVIHEKDLPRLKRYMAKYLHDDRIDGFRFKWLHFYGSFYRYRIDLGWFQKQDRIIRNNGRIESYSGAWAFRRKGGARINVVKTSCFIYHYGWVNDPRVMAERRRNAAHLGYATFSDNEKKERYILDDLNKFPVYFGRHPRVMEDIVKRHRLSQQDFRGIKRKYFWSPFLAFRVRYKTFLRVKEKLPVIAY